MKESLAQKQRDETGLRDTFDWIADRYVDQTERVSRGRYRKWMDDVASRVAEFSPDSVADLGCGPGALLVRLKERMPGVQCRGVDYSERMLSLVPEDIETEWRPLSDWAEGAKDRFDVITMTFVLRDQPDPEAVLRVLQNRLRPQGRLVILETQTPVGWRRPGFQWYFHQWLPWWAEQQLTPDWPGEAAKAPYRWLSQSHRTWTETNPLPTALTRTGYQAPRRHTSPQDVVMLWSAEAPG